MSYTFHLMICLKPISSLDRDTRFWNVRWLVYVWELTLSPTIVVFLVARVARAVCTCFSLLDRF